MSILACVVSLAAGLSCDPNRPLTPGVRAGGGTRVLANQDSVSASYICGNRVSLKNMNNDSITLNYTYTPWDPNPVFSPITLPGRIAGQPYSDTFYLFAGVADWGIVQIRIGTRVIYQQYGGTCPTRPAVPAAAPTTTDAATLAQGSAYMVTDPAVTGGVFSRRRLWVSFQPSASQAVRQAVLDAVGGTVLGGEVVVDPAKGHYYVEFQLPADSGLTPIVRIHDTLLRNTAVRLVKLDAPNNFRDMGVGPADSAGFDTWRFGTFSTADKNWHLEAVNAPLAWGCETGNASTAVAMVDLGDVSNADLQPNIDALSSAGTADGHAVRGGSILAARGNNGHGTTGVMWKAKLRYYDRTANPTGVSGCSRVRAGWRRPWQTFRRRSLTALRWSMCPRVSIGHLSPANVSRATPWPTGTNSHWFGTRGTTSGTCS